jgi:hypothetical protein
MDRSTYNCRSQGIIEHGSTNWRQVCDCAMLGALHRVLNSKPQTWYRSGTAGCESRMAISVGRLVDWMEAVRTETIAETQMATTARRGAQYHKHCSPWPAYTLFEVQSIFKVEDLVPVDKDHFKKQKAMSGVRDLTPAGPRFFS